MLCPVRALAEDVLRTALYPVGMTQLEYVDPSDGGRPLNLMLSLSGSARTRFLNGVRPIVAAAEITQG